MNRPHCIEAKRDAMAHAARRAEACIANFCVWYVNRERRVRTRRGEETIKDTFWYVLPEGEPVSSKFALPTLYARPVMEWTARPGHAYEDRTPGNLKPWEGTTNRSAWSPGGPK